jgi:uncharacterized protein
MPADWWPRLAQADSAAATPRLSTTAVTVLLSAPVLLTLREYVFTGPQVARGLRESGLVPTALPHDRLFELACWSLGQVVCFLVLPALIVLLLRLRVDDLGLKPRGLTDYWWIYAAMYGAMLPLILMMATTREFQGTYPFFAISATERLWPRFWIWQGFYAAQFVALEFFFRGFLLHGLRRELGVYAILVATIPYCMIHFGKPLPETLGSIVAGVLLGYLSYATRGIWLGAVLHIAVAVTMDLAALWNVGRWR